jgi:protein-disulfide isomerase
MSISRRFLLTALPAAALVPDLARAEGDPRLGERAVGKPDAPVMVLEFFSLTCSHCARFAQDVLPRIHKELIEPGKLRIVYRDFPLDQVALAATMVARALPPHLYEPFVLSLLASQDRWAFARDVNTNAELWKRAALAGMSRATFDATLADTKLRDGLLQMQDADAKTYHVDSTPSFIFNGPGAQGVLKAGEMTFEQFAAMVAEVSASKG